MATRAGNGSARPRGGPARILELERAAALHWQAPERAWLGEWLLRAAAGFTGRANSALPLGDPGMPLPEAVAYVADWYRRRDLPPMIALPRPLGPYPAGPLETHLAEREWVLPFGSILVMTAEITDLPAPPAAARVRLDPEPDAAWLALYRFRGQELPPIASALLMSAPWQSFASVRRDGRAVAVGRVSVAGEWGAITAVDVAASCRRQGLATEISAVLAAAAVGRGASRLFLQVEMDNAPARALYASCGFRDSHRYYYRVPPGLPTLPK
jgi:ribosomal protein S18 acetylase RimI-like enzyme